MNDAPNAPNLGEIELETILLDIETEVDTASPVDIGKLDHMFIDPKKLKWAQEFINQQIFVETFKNQTGVGSKNTLQKKKSKPISRTRNPYEDMYSPQVSTGKDEEFF